MAEVKNFKGVEPNSDAYKEKKAKAEEKSNSNTCGSDDDTKEENKIAKLQSFNHLSFNVRN